MSIQRVSPENYDHPHMFRGKEVPVHFVDYEDPFIDDTFELVNAELEEIELYGFYGDPAINIARKRKKIQMDNPGTAEMLRRYPDFQDWLESVPTAAALSMAYNPDSPTYPNGKPVSEALRHWFRNIADTRGLRSRGFVTKEILKAEAEKNEDEPFKVLGLASGAAENVLDAAVDIAHDYGTAPDMTLVDLDKKALARAQSRAASLGLEDKLHTRKMNILDPEGLVEQADSYPKDILSFVRSLVRAKKFEANSFDLVEAIGLLEYLKPKDWVYTYNKVITTEKPMAGAESFLANAYELVKPGGKLVVGNMLDTHPQLGFTLNIVQWPHIQPRSIEAMLEIFDNAGLGGSVEVSLPSDGVYAVYTIQKPDASELSEPNLSVVA